MALAARDSAQDWIRTAKTVMQESEVDFFRVSPVRYWFDFLLSAAIAYTAATAFLMLPLGSWQQLACYPVAIFWL